MARLGLLLISCADVCRLCADLMTRGSRMPVELDLANIRARMCQMCADLCQMCADMSRETDDPRLVECADVLRRCAEACAAMTPEAIVRSA